MTVSSEQREQIKFYLEFVKVGLSVLALASLIFAALQWTAGNRNAEEATYVRIASTWTEHLATFVDNPDFRPFFFDGVDLPQDARVRNSVLALADVRIDIMDAILTYAAMRTSLDDIAGWRNTFTAAFKNSVVLCQRLDEQPGSYGLIVPLAAQACR